MINMAHKTPEEIHKIVSTALEKVEVGAKYFHYKNPDNHYIVEGIEIREENEEPSVRYRALYMEGVTWNRLLSEWLKPAEVDGVQVARFQKVN